MEMSNFGNAEGLEKSGRKNEKNAYMKLADGSAVSCEFIFGFPFSGFIEAEPVAECRNAIDGDIPEGNPVEFRVIGVDDEELPVGFSAINEGEGSEDPDSLKGSAFAGFRVELKDVNRIVVPAEKRIGLCRNQWGSSPEN